MYKKVTVLLCLSMLVIGVVLGDAWAQQRTIEGTVTSADDGNPLPGVNISVKNTTIGTTTNLEGKYSLTVPDTSNTLVFSFVGYATQEESVNGRNVINVSLEPRSFQADDVVVVGYGTQKKSDLTGSVSSVGEEEISEIPTQSLSDALQGKVAGLNVTPANGRPGSQPTLRIRGVGTLNNADPLFVVDGQLLDDIEFLSPNDVQSVEVLKDASATAIYGSRGANGVVLITTKKGRTGDVQISIDSYAGFQRVNDKIDMTNAREFAILANESAANEGRPPVFENPEEVTQGTDWQEFAIDDGALITSHSISASGGSSDMTYNISTNYFKQSGVLRGSDFQRVNLRVNNEYFLSDNLDFGHNLTFTFNDSKDEPGGFINNALNADPTITPRNEDGEFTSGTLNGGQGNPAAALAFNNDEQFGFRATGNLFMEYDFLDNFTWRSTFGLDWERDEETVFVPEFFVDPLQQNQESDLTLTDTKETDWLNENTLRYTNDFGNHSVNALAGLTFQEFVQEQLGGTRINVPANDPSLFFLNAGETEGQTNFNTSFSWGVISYLFRVNYTFKDRYLFTGTMRRDGSSRFSSDNRWGNFPSVAAGWRLSEEPFMEDMDKISNLKLRFSWGQIGNDKIDTDAQFPVVTPNLTAVFGEDQNIEPGATITELASPNLRWEETEQLDIGFELGLLEDRFTADVDYYNRETEDILVRVPIPGSVGVAAFPLVNAATVENKGFDMNMQWRDQVGDFNYSVGFVGSTVNNEVLSLGQSRSEILDGNVRNLGLVTRTVVGSEIGAFWGWKQEGIFQTQEEIDNSPSRGIEQPGDIKIKDINGDGTINDDDKTFLGSPIPDFTYGINLDFGYKNFDVGLDFDGQLGNEIVNARKPARGFRQLNYEASFLDRWTGPGTSNTEPRVTESGHNFEVLDRFVEDGDFFRLRNVTIGYTLPGSMLEKLDMRNIRIYVRGTNVFTTTDFSGFTPQVGGGPVTATGIDRGVFPVSSQYTMGVNFDF